MKKYLLSVVVLLAASIVALLSGCNDGAGKDLTVEYFEKNVYKVLSESFDAEDIFGDENPFGALFEDTGEFNLTLEYDLAKSLGYNGKILAEVNVDRTNKRGSINLGLDSAVSSDIDLMIYADTKKILASSDSFFGEAKVYSVEFDDFEKMKNDFSNSDLAVALGIDGNKIQEFCELYEINEEHLKSILLAVSEYEKYCTELEESASDVFRSAYEKCPHEITEENININGIDTEVLVYGAKLNEDFINELRSEYTALYEKHLEKQTELIDKITPNKLKNNFSTDSGAVKLQPSENFVNGAAETALEMMTDTDFKLYLKKDGAKLCRMVVGKDGRYFDVYFTDEIRIEMSDGEKMHSEMSVYHTEDSNVKTYGFEVVNKDDPHETLVGEFEIIKFENRYNLFVRSMYGEEISASLLESSGRFAYSESSFEICPDFVSAGYEKFYPGIELGVGNDSFVMEYTATKSIFEITESEILGICSRATNVFSELSPLFWVR